jgi:integrase
MTKEKIYNLKRQRSHRLEAVKETIRGVNRWKIKGLYRAGKRIRKFFVTQQEALEFIANEKATSRNLGERARNIPGHLHEDALRAFDILEGYESTVEEAAKFFKSYVDRRQKSRPISEITEEYIENKKRNLRSSRHLEDLRSRLGRFKKDFGNKLASEIETKDIEIWLARIKPPGKKSARYSPLSIVNFHRVVRGLFSYSLSMGYSSTNPARGVTIPKIKQAAPAIFTPDKLATVLNAASQDILPFFAIGAFAGLRASEIQRLKWNEIDFDRRIIFPSADITKSAKRRIVPMLPNLYDFLSPYIAKQGQVLPFSRRMTYELTDPALRAAGFGTPGTETQDEIAQGVILVEAPHNGPRHSFASYRLAATNDAPKTAMELGHPDTKLLFSTYRELVTAEEAADYWSIFPKRKDVDGR